jgi:hypothetical protein
MIASTFLLSCYLLLVFTSTAHLLNQDGTSHRNRNGSEIECKVPVPYAIMDTDYVDRAISK